MTMLSSMGIVPRLRSVVDIGTMEYSLAPTEQGTMRACCGHMRFLQKEGALEGQRLCFNSTLFLHAQGTCTVRFGLCATAIWPQ
jgi:hypothetical protein